MKFYRYTPKNDLSSLTENNIAKIIRGSEVKNVLPKQWQKELKKQGWRLDKYYMELKTERGLYIDIEFCIGDFCVGIYSSNGKYLLEEKHRCENFFMALIEAHKYIEDIREGKAWQGEDN